MSRRTRTALILLSMAGLSLSCRDSLQPAKEQSHVDYVSPAPSGDDEAGVAGGRVAALNTSYPSAAPPGKLDLPTRGLSDSAAPSMIIRTGQAYIEVDTLANAIVAIHAVAARVNGYIANTAIQSGEGQQHSATLEIKIPSANYDQAMSGLTGIGKLRSSTTTAEDVGEEFVDVNARMANAHRLEERLVALLATRTGKLDDVLAVERELARVREDIERYEGRLRFLKSRTAMSTLSVTVSEPAPVVGQPGSNVMADAAVQAWRNFVNLLAGAIAASGVLVPVLGVVGVLAWIYRRKRPREVAAV